MQTLKILKSQHPHQQQTPELLSAWHIGLDRLSDREIEAALKRYLETPRTTDFFPTLGEFLRHAPERLDPLASAKTAWSEVQDALSRYGHWASIEWHDSVIAETLRRMGGWVRLCRSYGEYLPMRRKEFLEIYTDLHGRQFNPLVPGAPGSRQISYQQRRLPEPQNSDPVKRLETQAS